MACIYEIYLDVLLVNNFLMDVLNLFLTGIFLRNSIHKSRILLAALFGSGMGVICFLMLSSYHLYRFIMYVPVPLGMVCIAFLSRKHMAQSIAFLIKNYVGCFTFSILTGGCMQWLNKSLFYGQHFYLAMVLTAGIAVSASIIWRSRKERSRHLYQVRLCYHEHELLLEAYYDTGNLLIDPYVGKPVSIIDKELLMPIFREDEPVVRLLPFSSMGEKNGLVEALTVEELYIKEGKKERQILQAVIALGSPSLFQKKEYQMILNCHLL